MPLEPVAVDMTGFPENPADMYSGIYYVTSLVNEDGEFYACEDHGRDREAALARGRRLARKHDVQLNEPAYL